MGVKLLVQPTDVPGKLQWGQRGGREGKRTRYQLPETFRAVRALVQLFTSCTMVSKWENMLEYPPLLKGIDSERE